MRSDATFIGIEVDDAAAADPAVRGDIEDDRVGGDPSRDADDQHVHALGG
jgi:hypothetical protein